MSGRRGSSGEAVTFLPEPSSVEEYIKEALVPSRGLWILMSGSSIFTYCVLPVLLYGYENWILDRTVLEVLDRFQAENVKLILKLPCHRSNLSARVALLWPSIGIRILMLKYWQDRRTASVLNSLYLLLQAMSTRPCSIVEQYLMLESSLGLTDPDNSVCTARMNWNTLLKRDLELLFSTASPHFSTKYLCVIASHTSWPKMYRFD